MPRPPDGDRWCRPAGSGHHGAVDLAVERVGAVQRRVLTVLVVAQVLGGVGVATGIALASLVAAGLSGSDVVGGAALTSMVVGAAVAALPVSRIASRSGRRPALLLGYGLAAAGALGAVVAVAVGSWPLLLVALLPFGAATAAGLAARFAATDLAEPDRRARALAVVVWAITVGAVAGPNLAPLAQQWAGAWGAVPAVGPFLLAGAAFSGAALVVAAGLRPDPLLLARSRDAAAAEPGAAPRASRSGWQVLRATPAARLAVGEIALSHLVMVGLMSLTPVHMDHGGASLRLVGLVISLHVAGMYVLSPLFGLLADRWGRLPVLALGALTLVAAGVVAGSATSTDAVRLGVGLVALGLGWSAALIAGSALLTDAVPLADRARTQGFSDVTMNAAGAVGGVLAGVVVAATSYAVLGLAVAALVAPFLLVVLRAAVRRPTPV
jgi:MFS family permease